MPSTIEEAIRKEAEKLVKRHETYASNLAAEFRRKFARSGLSSKKQVLTPDYWAIDRGFNPYYVRAHARAIAKSIERSLELNQYQPRPAFEYTVSMVHLGR